MSNIQPSTNTQDEAYWQGITRQFMVSPGEIYLNTGSWGVQARPVFEALVQRMEALEGNPTRNRKIQTEEVASSRKCLAQFVNAPPQNLTFVTNVTIAINHVVLGLTWQPGDEILTSDQEYGAINNCLHHASQRWGLTIRRATIPISLSDPQEIVDAFRKEIGNKTRLLICSHIASHKGLITPVQELADLAHHHGALIAIDGAHAPGMIPLDLETYGVDFYGGNCHKWLCAPKGTGFLYARSEVQDLLQPIAVSWGYDQIGTTRTEDGQLQIKGQPFLWQLSYIGTRELACFATVADAIALQNEIGKDRILARGKQLASYLRQKLGQTEWAKLVTPDHPEMSGLLSTFQLEGFNGLPLAQVLYDRYCITTPVFQIQQNCAQRVSTHIYNSFSEIDTLVDALTELREEALA